MFFEKPCRTLSSAPSTSIFSISTTLVFFFLINLSKVVVFTNIVLKSFFPIFKLIKFLEKLNNFEFFCILTRDEPDQEFWVFRLNLLVPSLLLAAIEKNL